MGLVWWLDWEFMKQNYIRYESAQNGSGIYPVWNKMLNRCVRHVITVIVLWNRRIKAIKYWYDAHSAFYRLMYISGKSSSLWLLSSFCFLGFGLLQVTGRALPCHESWPPGHHPPSFCSWWICSWSRDDRQRQGLPPQCCDGQHTHKLYSNISYTTRPKGVVPWEWNRYMLSS